MLNEFKKFASEQKNNGFVEYKWSDRVVVRGKQVFAVFGHIAYDVTKMKFDFDETCHPGMGKICVPIGGKFLGSFPDEGKSGIMGMYILHRNGKNIKTNPTFVHCGWLWTEELKLTNNEIKMNIIADIENGKNVIYPKPAGWV